MLRVLIVDDSPVARDLLKEILSSQDDMQVVGVACDGAEAVELVASLKPDIVTMDVQMPRMDGYAATRQIMITRPTPIVVVSGSMESPDVDKTMESLRAGALTVIGKPGAPNSVRFDKAVRVLIDTVRTMAEVKVVGHRPRTPASAPPPVIKQSMREPKIVAIAASTGGPQALHRLLSLLPGDFGAPILIVQHISHGFLDGFVSWLDDSLPIKVVIAEHKQKLEAATVYVAPEDRHLGVGPKGRIALSDGPPVEGFRPAATCLFDSVAKSYGKEALACVLTGMGRDGSAGLYSIRQKGGFVLAQDEASCVVFGMPAAAIEAGLADHIDSLEGIAASLTELVMHHTH